MPFDCNESTHPAWQEGRRAFRAEVPLGDCPHDYGTDAAEAWSQGWQEALANAEKMTPKFEGGER